MINRFKLRNFDDHHDDFHRPCVPLDYVKSDTLYDNNKGVTHFIFKDPNSDNHRIVSDVEICMSDSPEITSQFPAEYRNALRNKLQNQPHSPLRSTPVSDDDLIATSVSPQLEMDERADLVKSRSKAFFDKATDLVMENIVSKDDSKVTSESASSSDSSSSV